MINAWVLNASPVILYARIRRLDIMERLAPDGYVTVVLNTIVFTIYVWAKSILNIGHGLSPS